MFQSRLQGFLFVVRKYWDVLGADQTERGIWVREIDIHYRKRKLTTLRLGCESVKQLKHFEKKNVMTTLWEPCDNRLMFKWWYDLSILQRQQWLVVKWTLRQYVVTNFKQFNLFSTSRYNVSQHHWEAVSKSQRICCQIWLYINYEAKSGYHYYLRSVTSFHMFPVSCPWMRVEMNGETDL